MSILGIHIQDIYLVFWDIHSLEIIILRHGSVFSTLVQYIKNNIIFANESHISWRITFFIFIKDMIEGV